MTDPILLFGVVLLGIVMLWFFGAFDDPVNSRYDVALGGGSLTFRDDWVELEFCFENPADLDDLRHIPLSMANKTAGPLKIESCMFTDPAGRKQMLLTDDFSDVASTGELPRHTVVEPGRSLEVVFIPRRNIKFSERLYNKIGGAKAYKHRDLLFEEWLDQENFGFRVNLSISATNLPPRSYDLDFKAVRHVPLA